MPKGSLSNRQFKKKQKQNAFEGTPSSIDARRRQVRASWKKYQQHPLDWEIKEETQNGKAANSQLSRAMHGGGALIVTQAIFIFKGGKTQWEIWKEVETSPPTFL